MKTQTRLLAVTLLLAALPLGAMAQTASGDFGPRAGDREFTLGGAGASNRKFNDSFGGANAAYGMFLNDTQELSIRQSINYTNSAQPGSRQQWNGSTRLAFDQHFVVRGPWRPFVGVNFGGAYGDSVTDTWAAGIEAGVKYYVQPRTFVYVTPEYNWFFRHASGLDRRFNDGQFNWSVGVGFNF